MMNTTVTDVSTKGGLSHEEAMHLQSAELDRTLDLLQLLDDADWSTQTECPAWDVRRMYLHVLGTCEAGASMRENLHQLRAAKRRQKTKGDSLEAGLSAVQVRERLDVTPVELVERLTAVAPIAVRKRTKLPSLVRRVRLKIDAPVVESWPLGYLIGTIYLRDLWMHRVDAARATDHALALSPEHDGRIVADVVAEWARRHGHPFTLTLTGTAGGTYTSTGAAGTTDSVTAAAPTFELDAVEFCRILAGREDGTGLLSTIVPF
jgi:uncharacterized protein (TIGR03083 family)